MRFGANKMILKNITTRKSALKTGLLFWITVEIENHSRHIYRCVVDFEKGAKPETVIEGLEDLIRQIRDA